MASESLYNIRTLFLSGGEILDLMIRHHANPEIAQQLGIADKAIRNHISSIFQ
jgi:DNA-binding CsgD family transcriptional regulator